LAARESGPIAVVDIGSNSIRLVVYDQEGRSPQVMFNEKVLCGLGRGLAQTGRLAGDGVAQARANLHRFAALARGMGAREVIAVATAAVRDASNGPAFAQDVAASTGLAIRILSGEEEARLSALGVLSGIPDAVGVMGDLGGGSLELVGLQSRDAGHRVSLPLGPLRLIDQADGDRRRAMAVIDRHLAPVGWLARHAGKDFVAVGGSWRMLARLLMQRDRWPIHVIHQYALPADEAARRIGRLARLDKDAQRTIADLPRRRAEAVPWAAMLMERLLAVMAPGRLVFSAFGLREGCLFDRLPPDVRRRDPLMVAAEAIRRQARFPDAAPSLLRFVTPVLAPTTATFARLNEAAVVMSDVAWSEHPDYRVEHAFERVMRLPCGGIDHEGRVYLAMVMASRYGGDVASLDPRIVDLLPPPLLRAAQTLGLALRLAYTLSAGAGSLLAGARLALADGRVELAVSPSAAVGYGDAVVRRLDALARHLGLGTETRTLDAA
jgi:exopolyphosphatase/guanosine-5'-triphosphate,3'-diphosphate pyrophosphatase